MRRLPLIIVSLLIAACAGDPGSRTEGSRSILTIADTNEPGSRMIVSGTVRDRDGEPIGDADVYAYHTDINGVYARDGGDEIDPRLKGRLRTDASGRFEIRTIRPGPYPNSRTPAHIHFVVSAVGYREKHFEIFFDDDPYLNDEIRRDAGRDGSPFAICRTTRGDDGVERCTQDIRMQHE